MHGDFKFSRPSCVEVHTILDDTFGWKLRDEIINHGTTGSPNVAYMDRDFMVSRIIFELYHMVNGIRFTDATLQWVYVCVKYFSLDIKVEYYR